MFYELQLPEGEDWEAIVEDLRATKMEKRELEKQIKYVISLFVLSDPY